MGRVIGLGGAPNSLLAKAASRTRELAGDVPTSVWLALGVALMLRVLLVALTWHVQITLDPSDFNRTAASIASGHGYPSTNRAPGGGPSAFRPPGYPVLLAAVYALIGQNSPAAGRVLGALLGTLSVGMIGLIAMRLWDRRVAVTATWIGAVAPPLVVLSTALISEALFVPLVLGAMLTALKARDGRRPYRWAIATGVLVGLAALTRTNGLVLLLPFALAFVPALPRKRLRTWLPPGIVIGVACLTIAPWTIRNLVVFGDFIPISDESGYTLAGTYNQVSHHAKRTPALWIEAEHGASPEYARILRTARREHWNEPTYGSHLQSASLNDIKQDPGYVLKVAYWNTLRMFDLTEVRVARNNLANTDIPLAPALFLINTGPLLLVLGLGGFLIRRARRAPLWVWLVPLCLLSSVLVTSFIRFRAPIDPFLVMLAAVLLVDIRADLARLRRQWAALGEADRERRKAAQAGEPTPM